jgi:protocatechuate 3,4-dioxygenase beta subunit
MPDVRRLTPFVLLLAAAASQEPAPAPAPPAEPRVAAPRTGTEPELAPLLAKAKAAADARADGNALLADAALQPLREVTEFRALVRERAPRGEVRIVPDGEPGTPLVVRGTVRDAARAPVADALVCAYHTSSKGWYSDRAPHVSGSGGDLRHARLFGYVRTDAEGRFVLRTIRPGGYPQSTLPEHIHYHVEYAGKEIGGGEILFDDDRRLDGRARADAARYGGIVTRPRADAGGALEVRAELRVEAPADRGQQKG